MDSIGHLEARLARSVSHKRQESLLFRMLGTKIIDLFKSKNVIIAGGTLTSLFSGAQVNDIDCYFRSEEDFNVVKKWFNDNTTKVVETKVAFTFKYHEVKYQLVFLPQFFKETPAEIYNQFDFTICKAAYDFKQGEFDLHPLFLTHLSQRLLCFEDLNSIRILNTYFRIKKYEERGFKLPKTETFKFLLHLRDFKLETFEDMEDQLAGFSSETQKAVVEKIKEQKLGAEPFNTQKFMDLLIQAEEESIYKEDKVKEVFVF